MGSTSLKRSVVINLTAGTADFVLKMNQAKAKVVDFSNEATTQGKKAQKAMDDVAEAVGHVVPQASAASAAVRALDGNPGIRAAERFLATTLNLGPALQAAFPLLGAYAFGTLVVEMTEKAQKFYHAYIDGVALVRSEFGGLATDTRLQNDSLAITNDRLEQEIAKLTGKPSNGLKLALDEAIESADKLASSLEKDLGALYKLTDQSLFQKIEAFLLDRSSTSYIAEAIGGKSGVTGIRGQITDVEFNAQDRLDKAKTPEDANAIRAEVRKKADDILGPIQGQLREKLRDAETANETYKRLNAIQPLRRTQEEREQFAASGGDRSVEIATLQGTIQNLKQIQRSVDLRFKNGSLEQDKTKAAANVATANLAKPYGDAIDKLDAKIKGLGVELRAITDTEENQVLAKGQKAAYEEIVKVNDALRNMHARLLDGNQEAAITEREVQVARSEAYLKFGQQVEGEITKTKERIAAQDLLTAAIGKGYEATKRASVEAALAQRFGEKYSDRSFGIEVGKARTQEIAEFEAKHKQQIQTSIDGLKNQTELESSLLAVQGQGKDAIDRVTFAYKLRELYAKNASSAEITAAAALFETQRNLAAQSTLTGIQDATADAKALAAAWLESAAAAREAALAIRIRKIGEDLGDKAGPSQAAARAEADQKHREEVERAALGAALAQRDQLAALKEQQGYLQSAKVTDENRASIAIALRNNLLEQNKIVREQVLQVGTLKDGFNQFWKDLGEESQSAAQKMYDSMKQALSGINDELAKFFSGAKTNWRQLAQGLAQSQIKQQLEHLEKLASSGGLKDQLGKVILGQRGINGQTVGGVIDKKNGSLAKILKRDGNTEETALYVIPVQSGGGIFASPPVFRPSVPGDGFASAPGSVNNFYLGTDPSMVERRLSSTVATGQATAISQSVQAIIEFGKRVPK